MSAGFELNSPTDDGSSLLHWASSYSNPATVAFLVSNGADVASRDSNGVSPLHEALKRKSEEVADVLIQAGASLELLATKG